MFSLKGVQLADLPLLQVTSTQLPGLAVRRWYYKFLLYEISSTTQGYPKIIMGFGSCLKMLCWCWLFCFNFVKNVQVKND